MKRKLITKLMNYERITTIASWRYFEYRGTISSASFPGDLISRYFRGSHSVEVCEDLAHQFVNIDHHNGESDWTKLWGDTLSDCDKSAWCKFYAFCKAYLDGFTVLKLDDGKGCAEEVPAFWCEYKQRWYPVMKYLIAPNMEMYCAPEYIVGKEIKEVPKGKANELLIK